MKPFHAPFNIKLAGTIKIHENYVQKRPTGNKSRRAPTFTRKIIPELFELGTFSWRYEICGLVIKNRQRL